MLPHSPLLRNEPVWIPRRLQPILRTTHSVMQNRLFPIDVHQPWFPQICSLRRRCFPCRPSHPWAERPQESCTHGLAIPALFQFTPQRFKNRVSNLSRHRVDIKNLPTNRLHSRQLHQSPTHPRQFPQPFSVSSVSSVVNPHAHTAWQSTELERHRLQPQRRGGRDFQIPLLQGGSVGDFLWLRHGLVHFRIRLSSFILLPFNFRNRGSSRRFQRVGEVRFRTLAPAPHTALAWTALDHARIAPALWAIHFAFRLCQKGINFAYRSS